MPAHTELNAEFAKIKTTAYKNIATTLRSQIVNKNVRGLAKTRKKLEDNRINLINKKSRDSENKRTNIDILLKVINKPNVSDAEDSSSDEETATSSFELKNVDSDGNCFYRALYGAAKNYSNGDLSGKIYNKFTGKSVNTIDESTFIRDVRKSTADKIAAGIYNNISKRQIENIKKNNSYQTEESRQTVISNTLPLFEELFKSANSSDEKLVFNNWLEEGSNESSNEESDEFIKEFGNGEFQRKYKKDDATKFYKDLAKIVGNSGFYASESDIKAVEYILNELHIQLNIVSSEPNTFYRVDNDNKILWLYKEEGVPHYQYWREKRITRKPNEMSAVPEAKPFVAVAKPCTDFYDPCTGEKILTAEPLKSIQKRIAELQRRKRLEDYAIVPPELLKGTRLDLMLWMLNNPSFKTIEDLTEGSLLEYKTENTSFAPDLFESYWDILLALGLVNGFERKANRYMYNDKVEDLERIPDLANGSEGDFIQDPIAYLKGTQGKKKYIKTSKIGGASDITIFYKSVKSKIPKADPCSYEKIAIEQEKSDKPKFVFASVKKFLKEKSIDKYDIMNIYGAAKKIPQDEIDKEIILLVNNDEDVKKVKEGASRQYIAEEASKVFGRSTMIAGLRRLYDFASSVKRPVTEQSLRKLFEEKKQEEFGGMELMEDRKIEPLNLLLHQRMTVKYIADAVRNFRKNPTKNNRFLIGILPRGGKTFIAGGLISELQANNIVVLLGAKSETQSQFIDELFYKYLNFNAYKIINVKDEKDPELTKGDLDKNSKHIFVMSIELFKMADIENRPLLKLLRGLLPGKKSPIDLFISDEAHLKQATHKSEKAIAEAVEVAYDEIDDSLSNSNFKSIPIVYMTGTFRKPKSAFDIPNSNTMIWDYEDVQRAKTLDENVNYFTNSFGSYFTESLQHLLLSSSIDAIKSAYQSFPELHLMETHFFPGVEDKLLTQSDEKGIPDMSKLFIINKEHNFKNPSDWHLGFQFNKQMTRLINFLGPDENQVNTGDDKMTSVITSIDRIAQRTGDRLRFISSDFKVHSQLWFLPRMTGNPLTKRMMALTGTIFQHPWFREHFNVFAVCGLDWKKELSGINHVENGAIDINVGNSKGRFQYDISSRKSLKERVLDAEEKARKQGKGLVILAQNMLQLGISLPCVSIVVLLDTGSDVDERIQKMYRALTQSPQKKDAFVVDLNYFRTVTAIVEYNIQAFEVRNKRPPTKEDKKKIVNDVFNIYTFNDDNMFIAAHIADKYIPEIMTKLEEKGYRPPTDLKNGGELMNQNVNDTVEINAAYFDYLNPHTEDTQKKRKELLKKIEQRLKRAKPIKDDDERNTDSEGSDSEHMNDIEKMDKITREEAYRDIFKTILRYGLFATDNKTVESLINDIKQNSDTQDKIYDLLIKRGIIKETLQKETLVNKIILPNLNKLLSNEKEHYKGMRSYVNDESKYPEQVQEVLNYINDHLAPKESERLKYGEVFTSLELIDEMLSKIPEKIWKNSKLRWLDPANGIGNFPLKALLGQKSGQHKYLGLFEGLREEIPDDKERYKHIIENMLFMIDINEKNNSISKRLFKKISPESTPNIEQIDKDKGCLVDSPYVFNGKKIATFDIIIGNPPFQDDPTRKLGDGKQKKTIKNTHISVKKTTRKAPRKGGKNKLYERISSKCIDLLNKDGMLFFITPDNIFSGNVLKVYNQMIRKNVKLINLDAINFSKHFKGVGQSMCYFMLINNDEYKDTLIISQFGEFHTKLQNRSINPINEWTEETEKLIETYITEDKNDFQYYRGLSADDYKGGNIEVIYTLDGKKLRTNDINLAPGKGEKFKIVLFEAKPRSTPFYDKEGKYGVGPHTFYYICKSDTEAKKLLKFFESKEYKKLLDLILTSQYLKSGLLKNLNIKHILQVS